MKKILNSQNLKKIGYLIVVVSVFFVVREIYYYFNSVSVNGFNGKGLLGSLYRYKQDSLNQGYLWLLLLLFGIGLIRRNMFAWLIPQTYLLIGNIPFIIFIPYENFHKIKVLLLIGIIYTIFTIFTLWYFRKAKFIRFSRIESKNFKYYYPLMVILAIIYWIFDYYGNLIIE